METNYIASQMMQVCPMPIDNYEFFRMQIKSDNGNKTNWLNITPDQFIAIERILLGDESC